MVTKYMVNKASIQHQISKPWRHDAIPVTEMPQTRGMTGERVLIGESDALYGVRRGVDPVKRDPGCCSRLRAPYFHLFAMPCHRASRGVHATWREDDSAPRSAAPPPAPAASVEHPHTAAPGLFGRPLARLRGH